MKRIIFVFLILLFCLPSVIFAYEVIEVKNGGSIEGTVMFTGTTIPKDKIHTISSDVHLCGELLPAEEYVINSDNEIKNVIVYIEDIKAGKPIPATPLIVDNVKCAFVPHVSAGFKAKGNKFITKNSDPIFHNVHTYLKDRTMFNIGLSQQGSTVTKRIRKTGIVEITCDAHPWMRGYAYIFDHPYATVTNDNGNFVISDIPPGIYNIKAWHEALGVVKMENIKVEAGKPGNIKLEYK